MPSRVGGIELRVLTAPGSLTPLQAGRVRVQGPTNKDTTVTPGDSVRITGLEPGDYTVALEGLIAGEVDHFGKAAGVHVVAGQTARPTVNFTSFVPTITSLPPTGTSRTFTVSFSPVTDAVSYKIETATDVSFSANRDSVTTTQTNLVPVTVANYGTYYVRVRAIDPYQERGRPSTPQSIQLVAQAADLVISTSTLSVTPGSVTQGDIVTLGAFTVTNVGNAVSNTSVIGFYLSTDAAIDTLADLRLGRVSIGPVAASGMVNEPEQQFTIPVSTAPRSYFLGVLLDETNQTPESNEGNNTKSAALVVKVIFQVDSVRPVVNAMGVETGAVVTARFSDGVDTATLTDSTFKVSAGGTTLATKVTYDPSTRTARLAVPLLPASPYQAMVTTAVQDTAGRPLASPKQWSFTTGTPQSTTVGAGGRHPYLVLDGARAHVVHDYEFNYSSCSANCSVTNNWTTIQISPLGGAGSLVLDGAGRLYVTWDGDGDFVYSTCAVSCTIPGNWPAIALVQGAVTGQWPSLVLDGGRLHAFYMDRGLRYATCGAGGVGCENPVAWDTVVVDTAAHMDTPSLALDSAGQLHVSYAVTGLGLKYATCPTRSSNCAIAASWQKGTIDPNVTLPFLGDKTTLAVDSAGRLHVAYYDSTSGNFKYATCASACTTSSNWQKIALASVGNEGGSPSLVIDRVGRLHVTYYDFDNSGLKYATCAVVCTTAASWQVATVDQVGAVGEVSSLQIDAAGRLHAAYSDRTDALNIVLKYIEF